MDADAKEDRREEPTHLELWRLDALLYWLYALTDERTLRDMVAHSPKKIGWKAQRSAETLREAFTGRLGSRVFRAYVEAVASRDPLVLFREIQSAPRKKLKEMLGEGYPPSLVLGLASLAGVEEEVARKAVGRKVAEAEEDAEKRLRPVWEGLVEEERRRQNWAETSLERRVQSEAAKRARAAMWKAAQAEEKRAKGLRRMQELVARHAEEMEALEARLAEVERERDELREANEALRRVIVELVRSQQAATLEEAREATRLPLLGLAVLVVGDEGHMESYRTAVEELGGEFRFVSGFAEMRKLQAALEGVELVVLVTAFASHKVSEQVKASGRPVVLVNQAGVESFRKALDNHLQERRE